MASKLVSAATSNKLAETDWSKNIEICELVARDHRQAKDVVKTIKKLLGSKHQNTQLFAVLLLEMLMNNIGESVHKQVIDKRVLPILVKIVMKTSDLPVRERIFLLLDAAQTSLGGASGRFPQYYTAYYELVSAGVQFSRRPRDIPKPHSTSNANKNSSPNKESSAPQFERNVPQKQEKKVSDPSVLQKAGAALEVLRDVLNTIDSQYPEVAKEEFTLDLVEQCSFAKQRVMQLAVTSLDEMIVTRAVELNEQLEIVLRRHDALLDRPLSMSNQIDHGQEVEEEEAEQLFRRIRKGKACMLPEDEEEHQVNPLLGLMGHSIPDHMLHRPLIRPLRENMEPQREHIEPKQENIHPPNMELKHEPNLRKAAVAIPPPPAKHVEREKFFQENKSANGSPALNGHMRNLLLHSRNASSSQSGSTDFSD